MLANQVAVKILARGEAPQEPLIAIFHRWIRDGRVPEHLLIDVADYRHVPEGPGVMLIAHQAHIALDEAAPGPGLLYARRRDEVGDVHGKLREALGWAAFAAAALEEEGDYHFDPGAVVVEIRSRLATPDTEAAAAELLNAARPLVSGTWGERAALTPRGDARRVAGLRIAADGALSSVRELADALAPTARAPKKLSVLG